MDLAGTIIPHELTQARSDVLDAFSELEHIVAEVASTWITKTCGDGAPLGQKLDRLADINAGPNLSREKHKILAAVVTEALNICEARNDVVHSKLHLVIDDPRSCVYLNTRTTKPIARVMSIEQHIKLAQQARDLSTRLKEWHYGPKK